MKKVKPKWAILLAFVTFVTLLTEADSQNGEFVAGSFILTQKALSEAPYRYSKFLTTALEKMEMADPPTKRDEENCNVRYRIEPSGTIIIKRLIGFCQVIQSTDWLTKFYIN